MNLYWHLKPFGDLSLRELYGILQLRNEVFVVEQRCIFADIDGRDPDCHHLAGWTDGGLLVASTRIILPGLCYPEASIGRVVARKEARSAGIGKLLMEKSIGSVHRLYGETEIRIGAQLYLKRFYESFGFRQDSPIYMEDGIEHIEMVRL